MSTYRQSFLFVLIAGIAVYASSLFIRAVQAQSLSCSGSFLITNSFANGGTWEMCWEERAQEGVVLHEVYYTAPGAPRRQVLHQASLAEIFVPYDDDSHRFYDIGVFGLGTSHFVNLTAAECPGGTLLNSNGRNLLCKQIAERGYANKFGGTQRQGQQLRLFSVSFVGNYYYIVSWVFNDDGSIQPSVQATGKLYPDTSTATFGWPLGPGNTEYRASHVHNYYWRLDFDLDGAPNDRVEQFDFSGANTLTRPMAITALSREAKRQLNPATLRFWRVRDVAVVNPDNHNISYDIEPLSTHLHRGPSSEPWTQNDFYVTQYKPCEQLATHNNGGSPCVANGNVSTFVNSETVTDAVVWLSVTFHHVPRDEDQTYMPTHWSGYNIVPRDWTHYNTSAPATALTGAFSEVDSTESVASSVEAAAVIVENVDESLDSQAGAAEVQGAITSTTDPTTGLLTVQTRPQSQLTVQRAVTCDDQTPPSKVTLLVGEQVFGMEQSASHSQVYAAAIVIAEQFSVGKTYALRLYWTCSGVNAPLKTPLGILQVAAENAAAQSIYLPLIQQE